MCGIAGRVNFASEAPVSKALLGAMCDLIAHRGPDGWDTWARGYAGFGHRRLAIIDLSDAGRQPMSTADGEIWLTFNGEIYNFLELKEELVKRGHRFRSATPTARSSSTPTASAASTACSTCAACSRSPSGTSPGAASLLARDRVGKKPLFYWTDRRWTGVRLGAEGVSRRSGLLGDGRSGGAVRVSHIPVRPVADVGVRRRPQAAAGALPARRGRARLDAPLLEARATATKRTISEGEAVEELLARLREAVRLRLISDVPLGAFLSGGIDSGSIVALMSRARRRAGADVLDRLRAEGVRRARVRPPRRHAATTPITTSSSSGRTRSTLLPKLVWHYNEPYADSSAIPTFILSELTRKHVTVALNGDARRRELCRLRALLGQRARRSLRRDAVARFAGRST